MRMEQSRGGRVNLTLLLSSCKSPVLRSMLYHIFLNHLYHHSASKLCGVRVAIIIFVIIQRFLKSGSSGVFIGTVSFYRVFLNRHLSHYKNQAMAK